MRSGLTWPPVPLRYLRHSARRPGVGGRAPSRATARSATNRVTARVAGGAWSCSSGCAEAALSGATRSAAAASDSPALRSTADPSRPRSGYGTSMKHSCSTSSAPASTGERASPRGCGAGTAGERVADRARPLPAADGAGARGEREWGGRVCPAGARRRARRLGRAAGERQRDALTLAWHRLDPWPDTVAGLTRLKRASGSRRAPPATSPVGELARPPACRGTRSRRRRSPAPISPTRGSTAPPARSASNRARR